MKTLSIPPGAVQCVLFVFNFAYIEAILSIHISGICVIDWPNSSMVGYKNVIEPVVWTLHLATS